MCIITDKTTINKPTISRHLQLKSDYESFLQKSASLFPKVDQKLLLNMLKLQTNYADWEGSVMLKLVYPSHKMGLEAKKDWIYKKFQRIPSIEAARTQIQRYTDIYRRT